MTTPCWPSTMSPTELADALAALDKRITSPAENAVLGAAADALWRQERENTALRKALEEIAAEITLPVYDAAGGVMDTGEEPAYDRYAMQQIARDALSHR